MAEKKENEIKIILIGGLGSGKTSIINAFCGLKFDEREATTITSSFLEKTMKIKDKEYNFNIWDTNGHENARSLTKVFLIDSNIVILVYRIDMRNTFNEIDYWAETVKNILGNEKIILGLVGNAKDLFQREEVTEEEGDEKARKIGAMFKLISAKYERKGIEEFFQSLVEEYVKKFGDSNKQIKLKTTNINFKKKSKCE